MESTYETLQYGGDRMEPILENTPGGGVGTGRTSITVDDLRPYFSTHIYRVKELEWGKMEDKLEDVQWPGDASIFFQQISYENDQKRIGVSRNSISPSNLMVLITVMQEKPPWGRETTIKNIRHDLHIFYYHTRDSLLFEATTSEKIVKEIHRAIANGAENIPAREIMSLLNTGERFFTVGMKNVVVRGAAQPDYKTLTGPQAHFAVVPTDRKTFAMSHALRRYSEKEIRGVGTFHSKAWAMHRDTVEEFRVWCNDLADGLNRTPIKGGPLGLAFSTKIERLTERPLAVYMDHSYLRGSLTITDGMGTSTENPMHYIDIHCFKEEEGMLFCEFRYEPHGTGINLLYSAGAEPFWKNIDTQDLDITVGFSDERDFEGNLVEYLGRFPPSLVMPGGGVVIRNEHWKTPQGPGPLPQGCTNPIQWDGCDIKCEAGTPKPPLMNILEWVASQLVNSSQGEINFNGAGLSERPPGLVLHSCQQITPTSKDALIICDHGSGEIADIIVIDKTEGNKHIWFYHCKAMHGKVPGTNVTDSYEVLGQACRNGRWVLSPALMEKLCDRMKSRGKTPVQGKEEDLKNICKEFICNEWKYKIVAVQPGFACNQIGESEKVYPLFVSTFEWLNACGAEFAVWGS